MESKEKLNKENIAEELLVQWVGDVVAKHDKGHVGIGIRLRDAAKLLVTVQDNFGHLLMHKFVDFSAGESNLNIPTTELPHGIYFTKIQISNGDTYFRQFTKP